MISRILEIISHVERIPHRFGYVIIYIQVWKFVSSVPQSISVITTWKEGRIPNACLQGWNMYAGDGGGFYVIMSMLGNNHTCQNILRDKEFAVNFPDQSIFEKCTKTIQQNSDDTDEITASGLTVELCQKIDAPRIKECFLNMECRLDWERPLHEGSLWHLFAGEVVHIAINKDHTRQGEYNRTGLGGFIYNVHSPVDPETGFQDKAKLGIIDAIRTFEE